PAPRHVIHAQCPSQPPPRHLPRLLHRPQPQPALQRRFLLLLNWSAAVSRFRGISRSNVRVHHRARFLEGHAGASLYLGPWTLMFLLPNSAITTPHSALQIAAITCAYPCAHLPVSSPFPLCHSPFRQFPRSPAPRLHICAPAPLRAITSLRSVLRNSVSLRFAIFHSALRTPRSALLAILHRPAELAEVPRSSILAFPPPSLLPPLHHPHNPRRVILLDRHLTLETDQPHLLLILRQLHRPLPQPQHPLVLMQLLHPRQLLPVPLLERPQAHRLIREHQEISAIQFRNRLPQKLPRLLHIRHSLPKLLRQRRRPPPVPLPELRQHLPVRRNPFRPQLLTHLVQRHFLAPLQDRLLLLHRQPPQHRVRPLLPPQIHRRPNRLLLPRRAVSRDSGISRGNIRIRDRSRSFVARFSAPLFQSAIRGPQSTILPSTTLALRAHPDFSILHFHMLFVVCLG